MCTMHAPYPCWGFYVDSQTTQMQLLETDAIILNNKIHLMLYLVCKNVVNL